MGIQERKCNLIKILYQLCVYTFLRNATWLCGVKLDGCGWDDEISLADVICLFVYY